jgi:hypothetical protein
VNELRRDSVRSSSKGLRDEGVKGLWKNLLTQRTQRTQRSERSERTDAGPDRVGAGRGADVRLRRVFEMKYFRFMDEIVTDGVGHLEG